MILLSGSAHPSLAESLAKSLGITLGRVESQIFPNGERRLRVLETVRGHNVTIVQTLSNPCDQALMELVLLIDAVDRAGARHINVAIPWMGYSLQDKVFLEGEPLSAKVVANIISNLRVHRVFLIDLHNKSIPGFFSVPTEHLSAMEPLAQAAEKLIQGRPAVVASPDFGGIKRADAFSQRLELPLVNIEKRRDLRTTKITDATLHGDVQGKVVLVYDDLINTGSTVESITQLLKQEGAAEVMHVVAHALMVGSAYEIFQKQQTTLITTNTVPHHPEPFLQEVDIAPVLAQAIAAWL